MAGIREQRERSGDDSGDDLGHHQARNQRQSADQKPPIALQTGVVGVVVHPRQPNPGPRNRVYTPQMSSADAPVQRPALSAPEDQRALNDQWRALRRTATFVALLSAPVAFLWLWKSKDVALGWALIATALAVFAFRGLLDQLFRRFIPQPSMFALDDDQIREEDVLNRRRHWFWRSIFRVVDLGDRR